MVLLDVLAQKSGLRLTVAHFDHGIRKDSNKDRAFVQKRAADYGLPFVFDEGTLGPGTSEAKAREARYRFLRSTLHAVRGRAIITAHHQDDALETAIINMLRGTGRKGISALKDQTDVLRPFLDVPKKDLRTYAEAHGLPWREDPTNQDMALLRNYVRLSIVPKLSKRQREELLGHISKLAVLNPAIESIIDTTMKLGAHGGLDRAWFITLPYDVATETMATWLRNNTVADFDRKKIQALTVAAKTYAAGKRAEVNKDTWLGVEKTYLALVPKER